MLEPAHYLIINSNGMKKIKYWDVAKINISENLNFDDQVNEVDSLIEDIKEQMVSDVPLGGFLSGGIDSSLIISKMSKINKNSVTTYTTGFNKKDINNDVIISDLKYARLLKNHFNIDYNEILINPEKDMEKLITKVKL